MFDIGFIQKFESIFHIFFNAKPDCERATEENNVAENIATIILQVNAP